MDILIPGGPWMMPMEKLLCPWSLWFEVSACLGCANLLKVLANHLTFWCVSVYSLIWSQIFLLPFWLGSYQNFRNSDRWRGQTYFIPFFPLSMSLLKIVSSFGIIHPIFIMPDIKFTMSWVLIWVPVLFHLVDHVLLELRIIHAHSTANTEYSIMSGFVCNSWHTFSNIKK